MSKRNEKRTEQENDNGDVCVCWQLAKSASNELGKEAGDEQNADVDNAEEEAEYVEVANETRAIVGLFVLLALVVVAHMQREHKRRYANEHAV